MVFNPSEFDKLSEHQPYDIDIELEEGKVPLFGLIYCLTPAKCEAVAEYVNSNLKCGYIHYSTSLAGTLVLFIKKKTSNI